MIEISSRTLTVEILDPVKDQTRFGTRYCTGGYIFQIIDAKVGPLLSGPTFPATFDSFNGQGIPDAFNKLPLRNPKSESPLALVIGVGLCDLQQDRVLDFTKWDIASKTDSVSFHTSQSFQDFSLHLQRTVSLHGRTVRSATKLANTGEQAIPISWFPHPFFPQPEDDELCKFNIPVSMPENSGYRLGSSSFVQRKGSPTEEGLYQALDHDAVSNLTVVQKHPALGLVTATCSFVPGLLPIWGNQHAFSWEPFLERTVAAGQTIEWKIDYDF